MVAGVNTQFRYYSEADVANIPEDWSCSICLAGDKSTPILGHTPEKRERKASNITLGNPDPTMADEDIQHVYHSACVEPWLKKSKGTCPLCKKTYNYSVVPKDKVTSQFLAIVKETALNLYEFLKRPPILRLYSGAVITLGAIYIQRSLPVFTLGMFLMSRGFACAENNYKGNAQLYQDQLERLEGEVRTLKEQSEQTLLAIPQPVDLNSQEFIAANNLETALGRKRHELYRWTNNTPLKQDHEAYKVTVFFKKALNTIVFTLVALSILERIQSVGHRTV